MRHENLGDVMLATTTRAAEKDGGSRRVSAFVALAAASSRTVRDAVDALAGCVSAMPIDDVDAFVDGFGGARDAWMADDLASWLDANPFCI